MLPLIAFLLLALPAGLFAQGTGTDPIENSAGTTYVVAFPDTTKNTFDARYPNTRYVDKVFFFIYSGVDNVISIKGRGYQRSGLQVAGGKFLIVDLMGSEATAPNPIIFEHCKPVDNTFRIEADQPIVVYQYMATKFGAEAWTAIPVEAWGNEYYAASTPGEIGSDVSPGGEFDYNRKNKAFPTEILVISAYDDTKITIVPNGQVANFCNPTSITLKANEAYQIQSYVDTLTANIGGDQPDFGGSRIFSTKPVGVISGATRAQTIDENIGLGKNIFKNMLIEWVAPVEQHGTEFVYMPSWDGRRPTGNPGEDPTDKRKAEFVRVYGTHAGTTQGFYMQGGVPIPYDKAIDQSRFLEVRHTPNLARVHKTDIAGQAMMHSAAVVKYAGTTNGFGGYIGAAYDGWGGYMVELTPREQWVSFAPYYSSVHPAGMEHFINVVVDTNHMQDVFTKAGGNFIFQRRIEGTDLIWGSMSVQPGIDNWLEGKNGAKFAGFVYGTLSKGGHEEYRPGMARRDDKNPPDRANGGGVSDDGSEPLHPSEYEEYLAIAYGYPLAPSRLVVGEGDSLGIKTILDCNGLTIEIESLNENPVGLRSIRLDAAENSKIISQDPFPITGAVKATVKVGPINPRVDASATIVIKDKTGKITRVDFKYFAEKIDIEAPAAFNFGVMTPGTPKTQTLKVTNPLGRELKIKNVRLINQNPAFKITAPTADKFVMTVLAGGTFDITVEANPLEPDKEFIDTVEIELECTKWKIPVKAETTNPCLNVNDLDFGTLGKHQSATRQLHICNDGGGEVTFDNPAAGGQVIEWLLANFTIEPADIARIKAKKLQRGDCFDVNVKFTSDSVVGTFQNTARLFASTRRCRDTSVWIARVNEPGPQITGYDWQEQWIVVGACSPADNPRGTKNPATEYVSRIYAYNDGDRNFNVAGIELVGPDAQYFELGQMPTYPEAIQVNDLIRPFDSVQDGPKHFQYVIFRPGPAERIYSCEVILWSDGGDTVRNTLRGIGIESHVQAQDSSYLGRHLFVSGATRQTNSIVVTTNGTRDVTINDIVIVPNDAASVGQFTILNRAPLLTTHSKDLLFTVDVEYAPTSPGDHSATLMVTGDFSPCDDSTTALRGLAYTLSARPRDFDFGTILTCFDSTNFVYVENDGSDPVQLVGITPSHGAEFSTTPVNLPVIISPGEQFPIQITFSPSAPGGPFKGTLTFDVRDITGVTPVLFNGVAVTATFIGSARIVQLDAYIPDTYKSFPGSSYPIEVIIEDSEPEAKIDELLFSLRYKHGMMRDLVDPLTGLQDLVQGTIIQNWLVSMDPVTAKENDSITVMFLKMTAPAGEYLIGKGTVLRIPFITYIGDKTSSPLTFFLDPASRLECASIVARPGLAVLDSVCGLNFRLISAMSGTTYALQQNSPNPFNPSTNINFSVGLDGQTSVRIYDANGKQVALLVNSYLIPGKYSVTWDASTMPSGTYYCRIESGAWSRSQTMMLQK